MHSYQLKTKVSIKMKKVDLFGPSLCAVMTVRSSIGAHRRINLYMHRINYCTKMILGRLLKVIFQKIRFQNLIIGFKQEKKMMKL